MEGKWRHVGTKIGSKIDANLGRAIFKKLLKNTCFFYDVSSFGVELGIKNRSKIEAQDEVPLSIDFGSILMGFESKLGWNIEPRAIKNQSKIASKK